MTRETKVGLIVGMGVILLIGIIVSDHLSVVQQQEPALINEGLTRGSSNGRSRRVVAPSLSGGDTRSTLRGGQAMAGRAEGQESVLRSRSSTFGTASGTTSQRSQPIPLPKETSKPPVALTPSTVESNPGATTTQPSEPKKVIVVPSQPRLAVNDPQSSSQPPTLARTQLDTGHGSTTAGVSSNSLATSNQRPGTPTMGSPSPVVAQPAVHYVRSGQTLWQIAVQYYGNGEQWKTIAQANRKAVGSDGSVREGVRLIIPNKASLGGSMAAVSASFAATVLSRDERSARSASQPRGSAVASRALNSAKTATVKTGDSLSSLAQEHLGSSDRWQVLYEANRDQLESPDHVMVGMRLRLPAVDGGRSTSVPSASESASMANNQARATTAMRERKSSSSSPKAYTVRSSDTLSSIARRELGDSNRWDEIFEANRDVLGSPDDIYVGQRLKLP